MKKAAFIALGLVALLHGWFFVLETLLWRSPFALEAMQMTAEQAEATALLAGNQGVYNLAFAVGLVWSLATQTVHPERSRGTTHFLLSAIIAVGIYGAVSARVSILFIQALPAAIALVLSVLAARSTPRQA